MSALPLIAGAPGAPDIIPANADSLTDVAFAPRVLRFMTVGGVALIRRVDQRDPAGRAAGPAHGMPEVGIDRR